MSLPLLGGFFCALFWDKRTLPTLREVFNGQSPNSIRRCRKTMRVRITLACTECKQRNYDTKKNKKNDPDRLEMKKHCRFCRKHTLHKETK